MSVVTKDDVREFIERFLTQSVRTRRLKTPIDLSDDCDLLLSGVIDSLGILEMTAALAEYCGQEIDFEALDPEQVTVVGPLCAFVSEQTRRK